MTEIFINRARTCAVTGHRVLQADFSAEKLKEMLKKVYLAGFDTFLVGMALGFDTECFLALQQLKKEFPIKIIACIPCINQDYKYTKKQSELYRKMLEDADEKYYVGKEYTRYCMLKRNRFMVDNCSLVLCYLKTDFGGTKNTVDYEVKKGVQILNFE